MGHLHHLADRPRLLVIEPNRVYLRVIADRLGELGMAVTTARSAEDGFAKLGRNRADLVLSELRLRGSSGIDLVQMVREDPAHRHLPVLLIAGRSDRSAAIAAFDAGADGVLKKPFHFELLAARIVREIQRARAIEKLCADNAALDARVISRAIELGEMRVRCERSEAELRRLAARAAA